MRHHRYVFLAVALTAILSLSRALGILFTYSQNSFIHEMGNFFLTNPLNFWLIIAFLVAGYFLIKKLPFYIVLIPLVFALMGLPFVYLTRNFTPFGGDVWDPIAVTIHLALAVYSFAILAKMNTKNSNE